MTNHLNVWNIVQNIATGRVGMVVGSTSGYGHDEPTYDVRYADGQVLSGARSAFTFLARTPQEWAEKNAETTKTNDGVPLDVANVLRYASLENTGRNRMYAKEVLAAAKKITDQWSNVYDGPDGKSGILIESKFVGESVEQFGRDARALYDLLKPVRGPLDWHPATASMLRIKVAAESVLLQAARHGAGNSGTH